MFDYGPPKFERPEGKHLTEILSFEECQNRNNNGKHLKVAFQCFKDNGEAFERPITKIIFPTVGDGGLLDQLMAALHIVSKPEGGKANESDFVGKQVMSFLFQREYEKVLEDGTTQKKFATDIQSISSVETPKRVVKKDEIDLPF